MGKLHEFEREKLIIGVIYHDTEIYDRVISILCEKFGPIEDECPHFSFSKEFSSYYDAELGGEGMRTILSFRDPVAPDRQAEIKTFTNSIEAEFSDAAGRKINLDPGFISHGRLLLATTKPTGFRIPLSDGIYTELTLFYARGSWQKLPWTYRDYQSKRVWDFLTVVRKKYLEYRKDTE